MKGSDPHNFWITSSKKEPLVLSFPSPFLQADTEMWCCLQQPWALRKLPRREQGRESSVTKNLHSTRNCGNVFFGGLRNGPKSDNPSALRRAGFTSFGIQRSFPNPLTVYLSLGELNPQGFQHTQAPLPSPHRQGGILGGGNMQEDSSQTSVPGSRSLAPPGDPPSRPARFGAVGPWGIRGTGVLGSPPPERPMPPRGGSCGDRSLSGGSCRPGGPHSHSRPKFDRGHEKAR